MIRYYLCPIIGTGKSYLTDDLGNVIQNEDPYRPSLADAGTFNWVAMIPHKSDADPSPKFPFALVYVDAPAAIHTVIQALPGVVDILDGVLTTESTKAEAWNKLSSVPFNSLPAARRTQIRQRAQALFGDVNNIDEGSQLERWLYSVMARMEPQGHPRQFFVGA